jgi:hypothetical protein
MLNPACEPCFNKLLIVVSLRYVTGLMLRKLRKRVSLSHNLSNLLYGKSFTEPLMEKNVYDTNRLLFPLQNYGFANVQVRLMAERSLDGMLLLCQKERPVNSSVISVH